MAEYLALVLAVALALALSGLLLQKTSYSRTLSAQSGRMHDLVVRHSQEKCELFLRLQEDARRERAELLTRIQLWQPEPTLPPVPAAPATPSQPAEEVEEERRYTNAQLLSMNLRENPDGGMVDVRNGALFENMEAAMHWRGQMRGRGLPEDIHPGVAEDEGMSAALEEQKARHGTTQKAPA